jgi:anti-anti-sigma factor
LGHLWERRPPLPLPDPCFPMRTEAASHTTLLKIIDKSLDGEKMQAIARGWRRPANEPTRHQLRLDFGNVEFLTASALGHLVVLHKEAEALDGRLILYNVGAMVYEVFAATRLTTLLNVRLGHEPISKTL